MKHDVKVESVRHDKLTRIIDRHELTLLLQNFVLAEANRSFDPKTDKIELSFADATEGSPSYKVGTRVTVHITLDVSTQQ